MGCGAMRTSRTGIRVMAGRGCRPRRWLRPVQRHRQRLGMVRGSVLSLPPRRRAARRQGRLLPVPRVLLPPLPGRRAAGPLPGLGNRQRGVPVRPGHDVTLLGGGGPQRGRDQGCEFLSGGGRGSRCRLRWSGSAPRTGPRGRCPPRGLGRRRVWSAGLAHRGIEKGAEFPGDGRQRPDVPLGPGHEDRSLQGVDHERRE